jgi:biotin carboxyl carrier protein
VLSIMLRGIDAWVKGVRSRVPSGSSSGTFPAVRYFVALDPSADAKPVVVDVHELPNGALTVTVDGRKADVDVVAVGGQLSVRVDGRVVDLTTEGTLPEIGAIASGHRSYVRVESERQRAADAAKKGAKKAGDSLVRAPMPGRIVKVFVKKGDSVEAGQPLIVMEAMKMENEIKAKAACTIAEVHVDVGVTVESNAKLITLA